MAADRWRAGWDRPRHHRQDLPGGAGRVEPGGPVSHGCDEVDGVDDVARHQVHVVGGVGGPPVLPDEPHVLRADEEGDRALGRRQVGAARGVDGLQELAAPLGVRVALVTGGLSAAERRRNVATPAEGAGWVAIARLISLLMYSSSASLSKASVEPASTAPQGAMRRRRAAAALKFHQAPSFSRSIALRLRISGRTSSRMSILAKSASQRSGVISG